MSKPYIQLVRGEKTEDLIESSPNAFLLLSIIALRARRTPNFMKGLDVCECMVGDYRKIGLSEQQYRTAKNVLHHNGLVTFHTTNKGTVAKINNSDIYNINICQYNGQSNRPATGQQQASNGQANTPATTNKNVKKEKNVKNEKTPETFSGLLSRYTDQKTIQDCFTAIRSTRKTGHVADSVLMAQLKKWDRYPVEQVIGGITRYLDKDYAGEGKDERYLCGIIRNFKPDRENTASGHKDSLLAGQQWDLVVRAIGSVGRYGTPRFENSFTHELVHKRFGWSKICDARSRDIVFLGKEFKAEFDRLNKS